MMDLATSEPAGFSSDEWCTPADLAHDLGPFHLDPCSNSRSHIHAKYRIALPDDGLVQTWGSLTTVFVNPPYSNPMPWCRKLAEHQAAWCALTKLDPSTRWHAVLVNSGCTWAPFRARLKFERPDKPPMTANFPSVLVWGGGWKPSKAVLARLWSPRRG